MPRTSLLRTVTKTRRNGLSFELSSDKSRYGWIPHTIYGGRSSKPLIRGSRFIVQTSFDPAAESKCEELLKTALQVDPENTEALQSLASVRMSQERPEEAKGLLEKSWFTWQNLDTGRFQRRSSFSCVLSDLIFADDPRLPPIASRLNLTKLFLELSLFTPALMVLQGIMASDDEEVEAWYLEGWCFFLMSEQAREKGGKLEELTWEELARDSRDCLETCNMVCSHRAISCYAVLKTPS